MADRRTGTRWRPGGARRARELPAWTLALADGEDAGYFGPGSAVWTVHGSLPTLVAGVRALLIQTLHPGAMAGVHDWSDYRSDPLARLDGTVRWIATTSFGDRRAAREASAFVARLHDRVRGTYTDASGAERPYSAHDPDLLRWVHDAFADAFLGAHAIWGRPIPGGPDAYVREWAEAGRLMGVPDPPETVAALHAELDGFLVHAKVDERVRATVRFLRRPGLHGVMAAAYPLVFGAAVASLELRYRRLLGLRRPWWPAITLTRALFAAIARLEGAVSPSEQQARRRIARLAADGRMPAAVPE